VLIVLGGVFAFSRWDKIFDATAQLDDLSSTRKTGGSTIASELPRIRVAEDETFTCDIRGARGIR
jgi:hypothetical protein